MFEGPGFIGFDPGAVRWFEALAADNTKAWFEANRATYDAGIKAPLAALLDEVAARRGGKAKVFRQNRDVRFSKNKSPYKTSTYGSVSRDGRLSLFVSISATGVFVGTGLYDPGKERLSELRDAIADDDSGPRFERVLAEAERHGAELSGDAVKSAPRGFSKDHPRIELLRYRQIFLGRRLSPEDALDGRRPLEFALETWKVLDPPMDWIAEHVTL